MLPFYADNPPPEARAKYLAKILILTHGICNSLFGKEMDVYLL